MSVLTFPIKLIWLYLPHLCFHSCVLNFNWFLFAWGCPRSGTPRSFVWGVKVRFDSVIHSDSDTDILQFNIDICQFCRLGFFNLLQDHSCLCLVREILNVIWLVDQWWGDQCDRNSFAHEGDLAKDCYQQDKADKVRNRNRSLLPRASFCLRLHEAATDRGRQGWLPQDGETSWSSPWSLWLPWHLGDGHAKEDGQGNHYDHFHHGHHDHHDHHDHHHLPGGMVSRAEQPSDSGPTTPVNRSHHDHHPGNRHSELSLSLPLSLP